MDENLINNELLKYIKENVFKVYDLNGKSHDINHIKYVLQRAFEISKQYEGLDYNMLFTAVSYHDIGDHIDRKTHEIISASWSLDIVIPGLYFLILLLSAIACLSSIVFLHK